MDLVNRFAPEHFEIMCKDATKLMKGVRSAGAVFASKMQGAARKFSEDAKNANSLELAARLDTTELKERFEEFKEYAKKVIESL